MERITKNKEVRKQELIDAAGRLFLVKGYDNTAVSDIVNEIHVAQGTFYYHFKSKEDILVAFVEKIIFALTNELLNIAGRSDIDPAVRINEIYNALIRFHTDFDKLSEYIHHKSNRILHDRLGRTTFDKLIPILTGVIEDGIAKGRFDVPYPTEMAEILTFEVSYYIHLDAIEEVTHEHRERVRISVEQSLSRILRIKDYAFKLV